MGICAGRECNFFHTPDSEDQLRTKMLKEYLKCRSSELPREGNFTEENSISSKQDSPELPGTSYTEHYHTDHKHKPFRQYSPQQTHKIKERHTYDSIPPEVFTFQTERLEPQRHNQRYDNEEKIISSSKVKHISESESERSSIDKGYGLRYEIKRYAQFPSPSHESHPVYEKVDFEESYIKSSRNPLQSKDNSSAIYEETMHISPEDDHTSIQCSTPSEEDEFDDNSEIEEETKFGSASAHQENFDYEEVENIEMIKKLRERRSHHILRSYERPESPDLYKLDSVSNLIGWIYQEEKLSKLDRSSLGSSPLGKLSMTASPTKYSYV